MPSAHSRPGGKLCGVLVALVSLAALAGSAGAAVTEFPIPTAATQPAGIVTGPDGNLWFTEFAGDRIGRITPAGVVTEFLLAAGRGPLGITVGADNRLYFTERLGDRIGRIDPLAGDTAAIQASITEFGVPGVGSAPHGITAGPDGNLWFTEFGADQVGLMTLGGIIVEFAAAFPGGGPAGITAGPDGALWYTLAAFGAIGRITTAGAVTLFFVGTGSDPEAIAVGADGALWFTASGTDTVGRITTAGIITQYALAAGSGPLGLAAGGDPALWATLVVTDTVARVTTDGAIATFGLPMPLSQPAGIAAGPDGALWFTEVVSNQIGRIPVLRTLAVARAGSGTGTVTSDLPGINCGSSCAADFEHGATITLSGSPAPGSVFREWSGGGCVGAEPCPVTLTGPTAVIATFAGDLVNVAANRPQFTPGLTVRVAVSMNNPGLPGTTAHILFGALLPDGDTILFITPAGAVVGHFSDPASYQPLVVGLPLSAPIAVTLADFLSYTWTGGEPPGVYVVFLAAVDAGTGSLLGLSTANVVLGP